MIVIKSMIRKVQSVAGILSSACCLRDDETGLSQPPQARFSFYVFNVEKPKTEKKIIPVRCSSKFWKFASSIRSNSRGERERERERVAEKKYWVSDSERRKRMIVLWLIVLEYVHRFCTRIHEDQCRRFQTFFRSVLKVSQGFRYLLIVWIACVYFVLWNRQLVLLCYIWYVLYAHSGFLGYVFLFRFVQTHTHTHWIQHAKEKIRFLVAYFWSALGFFAQYLAGHHSSMELGVWAPRILSSHVRSLPFASYLHFRTGVLDWTHKTASSVQKAVKVVVWNVLCMSLIYYYPHLHHWSSKSIAQTLKCSSFSFFCLVFFWILWGIERKLNTKHTHIHTHELHHVIRTAFCRPIEDDDDSDFFDAHPFCGRTEIEKPRRAASDASSKMRETNDSWTNLEIIRKIFKIHASATRYRLWSQVRFFHHSETKGSGSGETKRGTLSSEEDDSEKKCPALMMMEMMMRGIETEINIISFDKTTSSCSVTLCTATPVRQTLKSFLLFRLPPRKVGIG